MHTLVIYDITDDKIRLLIAQACKEAGLVRIQKSAFLGEIDAQRRKDLKKKLTKILGKNKGNIQIFQICDADIKLRELIGEPYVEEEEEEILIL
ncbi:MAG: CRISPR-associated endonuclease Cas2 [Candidatus Verstraetearchaeota archaeon]|jgi:CRISPR-associated protein Cas2|nr:CRISPR-associated endonuclease Cas2 [Candidatus Verstraetearchaeota archaeon]